VSNFPEVGLLQMYVGGAVSHDAVVHYNDSFVFVQDDCVKVTGIVEEEFVGINMFSATRIVPSISARTIDKIDCTQAINPAVKTVRFKCFHKSSIDSRVLNKLKPEISNLLLLMGSKFKVSFHPWITQKAVLGSLTADYLDETVYQELVCKIAFITNNLS
jgi:hypothetical protein